MSRRLLLISIAALTLCISTDAIRAQDAGLVGWWKFEEASGALSDQSGNNNNGTAYNGVIYQQEGQVGYCLGFDGANDYITVGGNGRPGDTFSFGGWFKISATHEIDAESASGVGGTAGQRFAFDPAHGGDLNGGAGLSLGTNGISVYEHGSGYMPATAVYQAEIGSEWNHIMIVYNNKRPTIYLNGNAVRTGVMSPRAVVNAPVQLGGMAYGYYQGLMDEIRIYNRALSANEVRALAARMKAWGPKPGNGAVNPYNYATMTWKAGDLATSHDVYFGESYDDVANGTGDTYRGPRTNAVYVAGVMGYDYPAGLVPGTTYYWRIDEVNPAEPGSPWKGDVWSFSIPSTKAHDPAPGDGVAFVPTDVTLTWTGGFGAMLHTVHFGDDYDTVANASDGPLQGPLTYTPPDELEYNKTYYWRVDEFDGSQTQPGDVWSFTTTLEGLGELVGEGWDGAITIDDLRSLIDSGSRPPDLLQILTSGFSITPNLDNFGARVYGWVYAPATGDYTFWLCTDDNGRLYLSNDQDPDNKVEIARETGWCAPNTFNLGGEEQSAPIPLVAGERYYIEAIWQEGTGGDQCQVAWAGPQIGTIPTIIASAYVSPFDPVAAYGPKPGNRAVDVKQDIQLQWKPGNHATSHNVYFGTSEAAVAAATSTSPEFKGTKPLGAEKHDPGVLQLSTTYYWRVDEVNSLHPDSPWVGSVWSFRTGDFLVIDDMEDYNNFEPDRIFETWTDGWGDNSNGSIIGYPEPDFDAGEDFVERAIVHGGKQSMPFFYDNNMKYSEATMTLPAHLRNWTQEGVKALSLWYYGHPAPQGAFAEGPAGTYTMTGAGYDIWVTDLGELDEFHYAYKMLQGGGSITAKVSAIGGSNLHAWAKAGVMIRETLDPNSAHVFMATTNTEGIALQYRPAAAGTSVNHHHLPDEDARPVWIRLERDVSGNFTGYHANDVGGNPDKWTALNPSNVQMTSTVYIGLALTSHQRNVSATATFSNIATTGNVTGATFTARDIGITSNATEEMYVAIKDAQGRTATVYNTDPGAANVTTWTEWGEYGQGIALSEFTDKTRALNLSNIDTISIGFGTKGVSQPGGSGLVFFDDIRLYRPRCFAELARSVYDFNSNCVVDMPDLEILAGDWLIEAYDVTVEAASDAGLEAQYSFENNLLDGSGNGYTGEPNGVVAYTAGKSGQALDLDGATHVNVAGYAGVTGTDDRTCAAWIRTTGLGEIVSWGLNASTQKWIFRVQDNNGTAGAIRVEVSGGFIVGNTDVRDGAWHHVAAVLEAGPTASVQDIRLYVDGLREYVSDVRDIAVDTAAAGNVRIGEAPWHNRPFTGQIDEVRIYSRAISQAEVANLAGMAVGTTYHQPLTSLLNTTEDTDVVDDEKIDFRDYAALIENWLYEVLWP